MKCFMSCVLILLGMASTSYAQKTPPKRPPLTPEERRQHLPDLPPSSPSLAGGDLVHAVVDGTVVIEAEHYTSQRRDQIRRWYITTPDMTPTAKPDGDLPTLEDAGGGAYVEALPDTFVTEHDRPIDGLNLGLLPGSVAVLSYKVNFPEPGRYFVYTRTRSDDEEDNTLCIGLNDKWPDSGIILQFPTNRKTWLWGNVLRQAVPDGEGKRAFLDVPTAGVHTVMYSMREDGNSFDRFLLTTNGDTPMPEGVGPTPTPAHAGTLPEPFVAP